MILFSTLKPCNVINRQRQTCQITSNTASMSKWSIQYGSNRSVSGKLPRTIATYPLFYISTCLRSSTLNKVNPLPTLNGSNPFPPFPSKPLLCPSNRACSLNWSCSIGIFFPEVKINFFSKRLGFFVVFIDIHTSTKWIWWLKLGKFKNIFGTLVFVYNNFLK